MPANPIKHITLQALKIDPDTWLVRVTQLVGVPPGGWLASNGRDIRWKNKFIIGVTELSQTWQEVSNSEYLAMKTAVQEFNTQHDGQAPDPPDQSLGTIEITGPTGQGGPGGGGQP